MDDIKIARKNVELWGKSSPIRMTLNSSNIPRAFERKVRVRRDMIENSEEKSTKIHP